MIYSLLGSQWAASLVWDGMASGKMETRIHEAFNGQSFEVGIFRSEDAEGVAHLFQSVHGQDYPIKLFYDPLELI